MQGMRWGGRTQAQLLVMLYASVQCVARRRYCSLFIGALSIPFAAAGVLPDWRKIVGKRCP